MAEDGKCNKGQIRYYRELLKNAKGVKCVPASEVLDDYQLDYVKHVLRPQQGECYKNAYLLAEAFPEIQYCEGQVAVPISIDHAFNKVGDKYIDITFEFAIDDDPRKYTYVTFMESSIDEIENIAQLTGCYGNFYRERFIRKIKEDQE